ncbi:MAG TPA: glutathione S-transferase family protein [Myxococcota bacterium]|nr:glutathione S-transferase family protein [Myxococcota bacterium]
MSVVLYHHPFSRAANVVWMLEEVGVPYELRYVDVTSGAQKTPEYRAINPMGKLPALEDGEARVTESAAIAVYLADRYASGRLAPALDDPRRGAFLRWCFYAPSVIEPGCSAHAAGWAYRPGAAGWGTWDEMLETIEAAITPGPWLLGEAFSMADVVFGGTIRYMLQFNMLEKRPSFEAYAERLSARPASVRAAAINLGIAQDHGLVPSGG